MPIILHIIGQNYSERSINFCYHQKTSENNVVLDELMLSKIGFNT